MMREYQGANLSFSESFQFPLDNRGDVLCINKSGGDIPPYAPMMLNGSLTDGARQVIQPDEDSIDSSLIVFNGSNAVGNDDTFNAVSQYEAITATTGTLTLGDDIGTVAGQWYLSGDATGFKCRGVIKEGLAYASPFSGGGLWTLWTDTIYTHTSTEITGKSDLPYISDWTELNDTITVAGSLSIFSKGLDCKIQYAIPGGGGDLSFFNDNNEGIYLSVNTPGIISKIRSIITERTEGNIYMQRLQFGNDSGNVIASSIVNEFTKSQDWEAMFGFFEFGRLDNPIYVSDPPY